MKVILLLLLCFSLFVSPVLAEVTPVEEKTRNLMKQKSQMPESEVRNLEYWCLNYHLNKLAEYRMQKYYAKQNVDTEEQQKISEALYEKYSAAENFVNPGEPTYNLDYAIGDYMIFIIGHFNPLKMAPAQEMLDAYENLVFYRTSVMPADFEFMESCHPILEDMLDVTLPDFPKTSHTQMVNFRGDIVNVMHKSIGPLFERGYLISWVR